MRSYAGLESAMFATSFALGGAILQGLQAMHDVEDRRRAEGWLEHAVATVQAERSRAHLLEGALAEVRAEAEALAEDVDDLEAEVVALKAEIARLRAFSR